MHGFLDDQHVWDEVIAALETPGFERVQLDLAGCGTRASASGPFTYPRYAADVGAVVDALEKPFVIVGQSMGAPIAELVAAARPERALGLVLLTPVPLPGVRLPAEAIGPFRGLGGLEQAQRAVREHLSVGLSEAGLERLVEAGLGMRPEVVRAMADCWNAGLAKAPERSEYTGPVLIVRGADDGFVTEALVSATVSPRFASARTELVERAGHWPHLEQPANVVAHLDDSSAARSPLARHAWKEAFASQSADDFAEAFADDVVLEASVLHRPIEGRELVKQVMSIASGIYDSLDFTHEARNGARTYVEWEATAFDGVTMQGVTILTKNKRGQIVSARIHHRPLGAALRFSAELRERVTGASTPAISREARMRRDDVEFDAEGGVKLRGWLLSPRVPGRTRRSPWRTDTPASKSRASSRSRERSPKPASSSCSTTTAASGPATASRARTSTRGGRSPTGGARSPSWRVGPRSTRNGSACAAPATPAATPSCSALPTGACAASSRRCRRSAATSRDCAGSRPTPWRRSRRRSPRTSERRRAATPRATRRS